MLLFSLVATFSAITCASPLQAQESNASLPDSLWTRDGIDWPRMLGPSGDCSSQETGLLTDWSNPEPPIVWDLATGVGYGTGVAAFGRWFQFNRFGDQERLSCCEAETGKILWTWEHPVEYEDSYGYNNGPRCSPLVDGNLVYVYGVTGTLACLDVTTGKEVWVRSMNEDYHVVPNFFGVGSCPIIHQDKLWVMVGGSPEDEYVPPGRIDQAKPNGTAMVALDRLTGKELLRVGNYLASYSSPILIERAGRTWCLALVREGLMIFDAATGEEADFFSWRATTIESVNAATPVVVGDEILISEAYEIGSALLEFKEGKLTLVRKDAGRRNEKSMRCHWSTPIAFQDALIGSCGRNPVDTDLRCIDWKTGKTLWSERNRDRVTFLRVDGHILVYGEFGKLDLLRPSTTKLEGIGTWDFEKMKRPKTGGALLKAPTWSPPVYSHGYLYLRGDNSVICLDLRSKK